MSKSPIRPIRRRGISRIDQPSTRTHGWFVRAGFSKRPDGSYAPRHRKFFGDASHGGKRRALRAAQEYLAIVQGGRRKARPLEDPGRREGPLNRTGRLAARSRNRAGGLGCARLPRDRQRCGGHLCAHSHCRCPFRRACAVEKHAPFRSMMFDRQPTLTGELLELRPLRQDDWAALFAVASDPLIWEQHPDSDRYKEDVFRQFFADALNSGGALVAIDRATGQIIGSSRYHGFDATERLVEIGWTFLARRYWGGRYNGEMKRLMLAHAFQTVDQVIFVIGPENRRSRRAVEKIGAVYLQVAPDAKGRERVVYVLTKTAFAQGALAGAERRDTQ